MSTQVYASKNPWQWRRPFFVQESNAQLKSIIVLSPRNRSELVRVFLMLKSGAAPRYKRSSELTTPLDRGHAIARRGSSVFPRKHHVRTRITIGRIFMSFIREKPKTDKINRPNHKHLFHFLPPFSGSSPSGDSLHTWPSTSDSLPSRNASIARTIVRQCASNS